MEAVVCCERSDLSRSALAVGLLPLPEADQPFCFRVDVVLAASAR